MQNEWYFLQQHHIEDTSTSPFSSVVRSVITSKSWSLEWPTAAPSSITSLLPFILHCQLITSLKAFYLTGLFDVWRTGDSEEMWRGQELESDRETTAGINKQYLAWGFPKFFNGGLLLPPGNQHDRHTFNGTPFCCHIGEHFNLLMLPHWQLISFHWK